MREISLSDDNKQLPSDTVLVYGDTGSGKTTFSGGFPRPLFFADATEQGWTSLKGLTDEQLFEPDVLPRVWAISEMNDMAQCIDKAKPLIAAGTVKTIVVSSISFYADLYLAHLIRLHGASDMRKVYGDLGIHLREIRTRIHDLGVNVVWEALADPPADGQSGGPLIPGKQMAKFAAGVSYLFRAQLEAVQKDGKITDRVFKLQTITVGGYMARTRIGQAEDQLPNPLLGGYKGFLKARGYDLDVLRRSLPPIKTQVAVTNPTQGPKPTTPVQPKAPAPAVKSSTPTTSPSTK